MKRTDRTPVLVGIGVATQREDDPSRAAEPLDLMIAAVRAAAADTLVEPQALLAGVGRIAVPKGRWRYRNPGGDIARAIGADGAISILGSVGVLQQTLIADACTAQVPDVLKQRVYTARLEQNGATVHVFLSGADFWPGGNAFSGVVVSTDQIRFSIASVSDFYYGSSFDVGEEIGAGTLIVDGIFNATTSIIGTRMNSASSGNEGIIYLDEASLVPGFDKNFFLPAIAWVCSISRFELTRQ